MITASYNIFTDLPFNHHKGLSALVIVVISHLDGNGEEDAKGINLNSKTFETSATFNISAFVIGIIVIALYALFW